ncbi:unnamed protein product [Ranitomeya imitator]|uniref:Uncharacterized protein n=1 Tax=Ranitomeya imitator TaxID=111125 RepID=A0ABN9MAK4_9NEOB|nr:unnamed protein product [Ranitomeya imitator]
MYDLPQVDVGESVHGLLRAVQRNSVPRLAMERHLLTLSTKDGAYTVFRAQLLPAEGRGSEALKESVSTKSLLTPSTDACCTQGSAKHPVHFPQLLVGHSSFTESNEM